MPQFTLLLKHPHLSIRWVPRKKKLCKFLATSFVTWMKPTQLKIMDLGAQQKISSSYETFD